MKRFDDYFRRRLTPKMALLLEEYERCAKRKAALDNPRFTALSLLELRNHTVDDIFTIVRYVKRRIAKGDNKGKVGTFTPASLEFINLFGDYARFADRLQTAQAELSDRRVKNGKYVAVVQDLGNGSIISRLGPGPDRAPVEMRNAMAGALRALITNLETT